MGRSSYRWQLRIRGRQQNELSPLLLFRHLGRWEAWRALGYIFLSSNLVTFP